jgi:ElaB/YqjD/DUF883 family membrane-anchored ribosome-binding protein
MAIQNKHAAQILRAELKHMKGALALAAKDVKQNVKQKSDDIQDKMVNSIVEKPFKAMGIAILSGMVLGLMMRRHKHRNSYDD